MEEIRKPGKFKCCLLSGSLHSVNVWGLGLGLKTRKFPSVNKPGLGERHTKQIHTSLSDKMFIDNFSSAEELIDAGLLSLGC